MGQRKQSLSAGRQFCGWLCGGGLRAGAMLDDMQSVCPHGVLVSISATIVLMDPEIDVTNTRGAVRGASRDGHVVPRNRVSVCRTA